MKKEKKKGCRFSKFSNQSFSSDTIAVKGLIDSVRWPCPGRGTIAVKGLIDSVRWPCPGRGTQKATHEVLAQAFGVPLPTSSRGSSALPASHVVRG